MADSALSLRYRLHSREVNLAELAAVYDALMASGDALGAISNQSRCGNTYDYNKAGNLLSDLEGQAHECASDVVDAMEQIKPDGMTGEVEKLRVTVGYNLLCGASAEEVAEIVERLKLEYEQVNHAHKIQTDQQDAA